MRLLSLKSGPDILKFLGDLENESKAITEDIITLAVYSNQSYEQMWYLSYEERSIFTRILKDKINLEKGIKPKESFTQEMI
jgi:hypothetical protein